MTHRHEDLFEVNAECIERFLRLAGILVCALQDDSHQGLGFALAHLADAAKDLRLPVSVLPPLANPDFGFAMFAGANTALLVSFATHE
jgi:hypothetical protein